MPDKLQTGYIIFEDTPLLPQKISNNFIARAMDKRFENKLLPAYKEGTDFILEEVLPNRNYTLEEIDYIRDYFNNLNHVDRFRTTSAPFSYWINAGGAYNPTYNSVLINPLLSKKLISTVGAHEGTHRVQFNPKYQIELLDEDRIQLQKLALPVTKWNFSDSDDDLERDATLLQILFSISKKYGGAKGQQLTDIIMNMSPSELNWELFKSNGYGFDYWLNLMTNRLNRTSTRLEQSKNLKNALIKRKLGGVLNVKDTLLKYIISNKYV